MKITFANVSQPRLKHLVVVLALAGALVGTTWLPTGPVRAVLAVLLLLWLPGSALAGLAFGDERDVPVPARLAMCSVLSMCILALLCVGLSVISVPITRTSIVLAAGTWIVVAGGLRAMLRPSGEHTVDALPTRVTRHTVIAMAAVSAVAAAAIGLVLLAGRLPPSPPAQPFASFYLAGASSDVQQPILYAPGDPVSITVGLSNHSADTLAYQLRVSIMSDTIPYRTVRVAAGDTWLGTLTGSPPTDGCVNRLTVSAVPLDPGVRRVLNVGVWLQPASEEPICPQTQSSAVGTP